MDPPRHADSPPSTSANAAVAGASGPAVGSPVAAPVGTSAETPVAAPAETSAETPVAGPRDAPAADRWFRRTWLRDAGPVLSFVALAFWVTARLWRHPSQGPAANLVDEAFFEWVLAHGVRVVTQFAYPFVSYQMNVPYGVNLMANTSVLAISIPMTPVTLLFGPHTAFRVFLTLALIATPVAWYFVLSRVLVTSRVAAWVGALFCGFAPSMVSHANGHPNIVSQFLVPLIIWRTLRLRQAGRWLPGGLILGLLVVWQAFINLEILLLTAVGLGIVTAVVVILRPEVRRDFRPFVAGLGVAAGVALALLAYPLYVQFFGPQAYRGLPGGIRGYGADLASFVAFSGESIAGDAQTAKPLAQNPSEENAFFGWPLVVLVVALVWWMRRSAVVLGLAATGLTFALLSLGPRIRFDGRRTGIPAPWGLLSKLPVLDSVVPTRWALAIAPVIGLLLALGCERVSALVRRHPAAAGSIRLAAVTIVVMALLPIAPTPLPSARFAATPDFISAGTWRRYVDRDQTVVTLPMATSNYPDPLRWSAVTGLDMRIPRGYFLGPDDRPGSPQHRVALFTAPSRPTSSFFDTIHRTGEVPAIDPRRQAEAVEDLRFWRAGVVILAPQRYDDAFRRGMTELTGITPANIGGVWVWDVRPLVR
jgi:hypothetical protein